MTKESFLKALKNANTRNECLRLHGVLLRSDFLNDAFIACEDKLLRKILRLSGTQDEVEEIFCLLIHDESMPAFTWAQRKLERILEAEIQEAKTVRRCLKIIWRIRQSSLNPLLPSRRQALTRALRLAKTRRDMEDVLVELWMSIQDLPVQRILIDELLRLKKAE